MAQLNDLLVTGNSRFLNEINGKIDWLNINNKPTIIGTVTQVKVGSTTYDPTSGVISLPAYPSVPVTSVAGKTGAVTLTASDVGALASTTKYAGASTAGGSATSAAKLDTATAGSATQPCYFANGVPSACTYSLNKTVPSDAVFTDTKVTSVDNHYTPTAASASKITITSTGGYPKKIEISRDSKGHVTAATVTETEVIPDNDFNVAQTATSTDSNYEVLFSNSANNTTETAGARKDIGFLFNPSRDALTVGNRKSGTTVATSSIALGYDITASGIYSYAQGYCTSATNYGAHAEGASTIASGNYAHAEGTSTTASGNYAHSEGYYTIANHKSQHVFGEYNLEDASTETFSNRGNYIEIVGNGTSIGSRSNARTLDWDGNEWLAGELEASYFVANRTYSSDPTRSDKTEIAGGYAHFINRYDSGTRVYQMSLSGIDIELNNSTWDGTNNSLKDALAAKLSLDGGTMTGAITTATGRWYTGGNYVLHLNNSDMIGVNGIWFGDVSSDAGEGLMFPRANGNWDDLYSVDGSLYYCVNRTTAGARGSAYTILHTGNGVLSNGGKYTGGNKTAGYCLHGVGAGHTYACEWTSASKLAFWVDVSNVGTLSDRRLKDDIEPVNMGLVNAIVECESYQYKAFNRGGNISVGIMAQDLVENCKKYNVDPLDYELLCQEKFKEGDPTLYYQIDYDQLLYFKTIYLENKIKELEAKLDSLT